MPSFTVPTDPYATGVRLFSRKSVDIDPGLTPLVGCNGSGKSTFLRLLRDQLVDRPGAVVIDYDDRTDGGTNRISELMMMRGDAVAAANMLCSSEGERINQSVGILVSKIGCTVRAERPQEVWVLMDSVGSGLSADYVNEVKDFVSWIRGEETGIVFYFIVATNEYEFARGERCVDVTAMKPVTFKDYEDYRSFILRTRAKKDQRYEKERKKA